MPGPPLAKLLVPLAEAEQKITAQFNSGRQIVSSLEPPPGFGFGFDQAATLRSAVMEAEKWAKFTIDLLKGLLTDLFVEKEFGDSEFRQFRDDRTTEIRLQGLDSILNRLPLFHSTAREVDGISFPPNLRSDAK